MARKKSESKMTIDERITMTRQEINEVQEVLNSLIEKEKELIEQKKQKDLEVLIQTMEMTGISVGEAQELIRNAARTKVENDNKEQQTA